MNDLPKQKPVPHKPLPLPPLPLQSPLEESVMNSLDSAPLPSVKPKNPKRMERKTMLSNNSSTSSVNSTESLILNELIETERTYSNDLKLIYQYYFKSSQLPLTSSLNRSRSVSSNSSTGSRNYKQIIETEFQCTSQAERDAYSLSRKAFPNSRNLTSFLDNANKPILNTDDTRCIFLNIQALMLWSQEFVQLLEMTVRNNENIGELFCRYIQSHFEPLYLYFCSRQTSSNARLVQLMANDAKVQAWHDDCTKKLKGLTNAWDLPSLLIKPFQRILKYPLLIGNLIKCNEEKFGVSSLKKALHSLQALAERINDAKFRKDSVDQILSTIGNSNNSNNNLILNDDGPSSPSTPNSTVKQSPNTLKKAPPISTKKAKTFLRRRAKSATNNPSLLPSPIQTSQNLNVGHVNGSSGPPMYSSEESIEFGRLQGQLDFQIQQMHSFAKSINDWIGCTSIEMNQLGKLVNKWYATSSLEGVSVVENESTMTIEAYARILREIYRKPYLTLVKNIDNKIHNRLKQVMKMTSNPRIIILKRNEMLKEFEDSLQALSSKSRTSLGNLLNNSNEIFENFHALDVQLRLELPEFIKGMKRALRAIIAEFIILQTKYNEECYDLRQNWCQQWCTFNHEHTTERILKDWQIRFGIISDRLDKFNLQIAPPMDVASSRRQSDSHRYSSPNIQTQIEHIVPTRKRGESLSDQLAKMTTSDEVESTHNSNRSSAVYSFSSVNRDSPPTPSSMIHEKLPTPSSSSSFYTRMKPQLSLDSYKTAFSKQSDSRDKPNINDDTKSIVASIRSFENETDKLTWVMERDAGLGLRLN